MVVNPVHTDYCDQARNDTTVAVQGLCCIVTVLQVKKPDLTVNAIERCARGERKVANVESIDYRLIPICIRVLSFRQDKETRKDSRVAHYLKD
jgi:hypothetical protein